MAEALLESVAEMLHERGVDNVAEVVLSIHPDDADAVLGAIAMWDDMPHTGPHAVGPGLLIKKIREGGVPGYKRPHERSRPNDFGGHAAFSTEVLERVRSMLLSPDAGFDRDSARDFLRGRAEKANTPVDALIDAAMGPQWRQTPPHPAFPGGWRGGTFVYPDEHGGLRYELLVGTGHLPHPSTSDGVRQPDEDGWAFATRFWDWKDPDLERLARFRREEAERRAELEPPPKSEPVAALPAQSGAQSEPAPEPAPESEPDDEDDW